MFSSGRRALQTQLCEDISGARCPADPQEQAASTTARAQGRCSITKSHFGGHGSSHWVTPSPRVTHSILPTPTTETSTSPEHGSPEAPFSTAPGLAVASLCGPGPAPHPLWAPASSSVRDGLRRPSPADERQSDATARARPDHRFPRSPAPPPHSRGPRCPVGPSCSPSPTEPGIGSVLNQLQAQAGRGSPWGPWATCPRWARSEEQSWDVPSRKHAPAGPCPPKSDPEESQGQRFAGHLDTSSLHTGYATPAGKSAL